MNKQSPQSEDKMKSSQTKPDDTMGISVSGHILIRDKQTGQEIVNKRG